MPVSLHSRSGSSVANVVYPPKCRDPESYRIYRTASCGTTRSSPPRSGSSVNHRDMNKTLIYHLEKYTSKRGLYLTGEKSSASSSFVQDEYEIVIDVVTSADGMSSSVRFKSIMWSCDSTSTKMFRNALILNSEERVTQGCMLGLESSKKDVMSFDLSLAMHHPLVAVERDGIARLITNFLKIAKAVTSKLKEPSRQSSVASHYEEVRQPQRKYSTISLPPRPTTSFKWKPPSPPPPPPSFDEYSNATPIISNCRGSGRRIGVVDEEQESVGHRSLTRDDRPEICQRKRVSRPDPAHPAHPWPWPQKKTEEQEQKQRGLLHHLTRMSSIVSRFRPGSRTAQS